MGIQIVLAISMICLSLVVLVSSTYAWFTVNRQVSTGKVAARTAQEDLQLLLSGKKDGPFSATESSIEQVNKTNTNYLMPVSTFNLVDFSQRLSNDGEEVERYTLVEEERDYFHGRIYLKATTSNLQTSGRMALYFDQREEAGGKLVMDLTGDLTKASRLGLRFQTPASEFYIFHLAPEPQKQEQVVIGYSEKEGFLKLPDPSKDISSYEIKVTDTGVTLPEKPLAILDLDQTYALDIYYYLEGADPDCTEEISLELVDLHMAFYGVLIQ